MADDGLGEMLLAAACSRVCCLFVCFSRVESDERIKLRFRRALPHHFRGKGDGIGEIVSSCICGSRQG
jgi:hypothetical protein